MFSLQIVFEMFVLSALIVGGILSVPVIIHDCLSQEDFYSKTITQIFLELLDFHSCDFRENHNLSFVGAAIPYVLLFVLISPICLPIIICVILCAKVTKVLKKTYMSVFHKKESHEIIDAIIEKKESNEILEIVSKEDNSHNHTTSKVKVKVKVRVSVKGRNKTQVILQQTKPVIYIMDR